MIKFITPTGHGEAIDVDTAETICTQQAGIEAEKTTRLFSRIEGADKILITCNKQKWIINKA